MSSDCTNRDLAAREPFNATLTQIAIFTKAMLTFQRSDRATGPTSVSIRERMVVQGLIAYMGGGECPNTASSCEAGTLLSES